MLNFFSSDFSGPAYTPRSNSGGGGDETRQKSQDVSGPAIHANLTGNSYGSGVYSGTTTISGNLRPIAENRAFHNGGIAADGANKFSLTEADESSNNGGGSSESFVFEREIAEAGGAYKFGRDGGGGGGGGVVADGPNILKWAAGGRHGGGDDDNGPRFDDRLPTVMTVAAGQTAALRCRVFGLGNKTVSVAANMLQYLPWALNMLSVLHFCSLHSN
jgi:hypothetical protein